VYIRIALTLLILSGLLAPALAQAAPIQPDVIFFNGRFVTLDARGTTADAVAVKDGLVLQLGDTATIKRLAGPATRVIDLGGRLVVPGLIDGHTHPMETVRMKETYVDARFPGVSSVKQALANLAARVRVTPKGQWIFAAASSGTENKFAEKRIPTRVELDGAAPQNPVIFLNGAHEMVTNSLGLQRMGIKRGVTRLAHGGVVLADKNGDPTGDIIEGEGDVPDVPTVDDVVRYYSKSIAALWNANGFTSVVAITNAQMLPILNKVATSPAAPRTLRFTVPVWTDPAGKLLPQDLSTLAVSKDADPAWFRTGGIKMWVDGEPDARTGAVYEPYVGHLDTDFPGGKGILNLPQNLANARAAQISGAGLMCLFHASADHSTDIGLTAYENMLKTGRPHGIMRLEHFGDFMLTDEQLRRAVAAGIKISVQPAWMTTLCKSNRDNLGAKRADTAFRFRSIIDAGLEPSGGTDVTGIYLVTLNPFLHMWACVTRNSDLGVFHPEQAISVTEALKMWTVWAARAMGEEKLKGSLEPGKYADMTVLSDDIFTIPPARIKDVRPVKTIVGGNVVYEAQ
jgi:predicted amidohydrolase YtcJ